MSCRDRCVWLHEMREFFLRDRKKASGITVAAFLGGAQDHEEEAMARLTARGPASAEAFAPSLKGECYT